MVKTDKSVPCMSRLLVELLFLYPIAGPAIQLRIPVFPSAV